MDMTDTGHSDTDPLLLAGTPAAPRSFAFDLDSGQLHTGHSRGRGRIC
eukprot:COSAG02_NODE_32500_length_515_cov_0.831731_2_plen_47_part_01